LPSRDSDDGNGSRFDKAERGGLRRKHPGGCHGVLGVTIHFSSAFIRAAASQQKRRFWQDCSVASTE
jgi:hypothetical protein